MEAAESFPFDYSSTHIPKPRSRNECGTAGCVAGFAALLWPEIANEDGKWSLERATNALGLTHVEAGNLFFCGFTNKSTPTRKGAVAALRAFAKTGKFTWVGFRSKKYK